MSVSITFVSAYFIRYIFSVTGHYSINLSKGFQEFNQTIKDLLFVIGHASFYLIMIFFGTYVRNKSVNTTIASDWFTFLMAMIFSNLLFFSLLNNFSDLSFSYTKIGYNMFFTLAMFPIFWVLFNLYQMTFIGGRDA